MKHTLIEVKQLEVSPQNARRTAPGIGMEELKASILAHGLMQNLVVTEAGEGRFRVIAGGRRLEALRQLQAEGRLPEDYAAPCQVVDDAHAYELSLAENTVRRAMHPADEFEAFAKLVAEGETIDGIAERFGTTTRHVAQRLTLGRLAPELLAAYRAEELTLDCLMAFTITDDHGKQLQVYEGLQQWQRNDPSEIRSLLTGETPEATDKLARFVGLDAYHQAGGASRSDLFGECVYLESPELLNRLAAEKFELVRQELEAEGWKWVEVSIEHDWNVTYRCGRIHPKPIAAPPELLDAKAAIETEIERLRNALDEEESDELLNALEWQEEKLEMLDEELEGFVAFDPEEMRSAGCYVSVDHDGGLSVEKGLVRREDMKLLHDDAASRRSTPKGMPESLRRDLAAFRLEAARIEIARHRLVALDLLAFMFAREVVARRPLKDGADIRLTRPALTPAVQKEPTAARQALHALADRLPLDWLQQETEAEQFQAFLTLSDKERLDFLAYGVAISLQPQLSTGLESTAVELALSLTDADVAAYFRPTRSNYLGRISRDQLLALGRTLLGESWSQAHGRDKKGELADYLERAFAEPEAYARSPQQLEALRTWLPDGMAFGSIATDAAETHIRKAA